LLELKHTHKSLIQDYKCVEAAPAANDGDAAAPPLSLPPLNLLAKQHPLSEEEIGAGCVLPPQRRVAAQIMRRATRGGERRLLSGESSLYHQTIPERRGDDPNTPSVAHETQIKLIARTREC